MLEVVLSPHNDDEALWVSYTIMRYKPLVVVVTDSYYHLKHGVTAEQRRNETIEAMKVLRAPVLFLGIHDNELTEENLAERLKDLAPDIVYAPAVQDGNKDHDTVGRVAQKLFGERLTQYSTYTKTNPFVEEGRVIEPTHQEIKVKNEALSKYKSQLILNRLYFEAVMGKCEYYV